MKPSLLVIPVLAVTAALAIGLGTRAPGQSTAGRYHVDFARGSDSNDGTSPARAWKHAPGDPQATGKAAAARLAPGNHVIFAAGVTYRGEIKVTSSGTPAQPILFEGAPGAEAVIDGGDLARTSPCPSAAVCGGHPGWQRLTLIQPARPITTDTALFADGASLRLARAPDPKIDFYADEPDDMLPADRNRLAQGQAPVARGIDGAFPGALASLWVRPNVITTRPVTAVSGGSLAFDPSGVNFYPDRDGRVAIVNHPAALDRPGEYIVLPGGQAAVAMLPAGVTAVSVATGRGGFELKGASDIAIRNLTFRHMSDGGQLFGGIAVFSNRRGNAGLEVSGNRFRDMAMERGQGPITPRGMSRIRIHDNVIERIAGGSGIRLSGPASDVEIRRNLIRQVGRTAIMLMTVSDALVQENIVADVKGVHGNGMSSYLDNHRIRFIGNTVVDAKFAITFRGPAPGKGTPGDGDIQFIDNLLAATPGALGSLVSWGGNVRGVRIERNVMLGGRFGLRLNPALTDVTITGNSGTAPTPNSFGRGWTVENNRWSAGTPRWAQTLVERARVAKTAAPIAPGERAALCADARAPRIGAMLTCATGQ